MDIDTALHGLEGRLNRCDFHAHGLGTTGSCLRRAAAAYIGARLRGNDGFGGELHALHPVGFLRRSSIDT